MRARRWVAAGFLCTVVGLGGWPGGAAMAETSFSSKSRAKLFANQTRLLDSRAAQQYANSARLMPESVRVPAPVPRYSGA